MNKETPVESLQFKFKGRVGSSTLEFTLSYKEMLTYLQEIIDNEAIFLPHHILKELKENMFRAFVDRYWNTFWHETNELLKAISSSEYLKENPSLERRLIPFFMDILEK